MNTSDSNSPVKTASTILVTGATGTIGTKLVVRLLQLGYSVNVLTRDPEVARAKAQLPVRFFRWNAKRDPAPAEAFEGVTGVIHLAGESVAGGRWSAARKREILDSRELGTRNLVAGIAALAHKPEVLVSSSAIGYYGDRGEAELTEAAAPGTGFLAEVCDKWEIEARRADALGVRGVQIRTGIVLDNDGGALEQMSAIFRLGAGGRLGDGRHWMSWIHVEDLVELFVTALRDVQWRGPVNGVAPFAVRNEDFTRQLARCLRRPAVLPAPAFLMRLALGEMAEIVLASQHVIPSVALAATFLFRFPKLEDALDNLLRSGGKPTHRLHQVMWVPRRRDEVFEFFANPKNLESITPAWLNFRIVKQSHPSVEGGMLLDYELKVHQVPLKWRTLIEEWSPPHNFVDRQLKGPYNLWVHRHSFEDLGTGTLVRDTVDYRVPFGIVGDLVQKLFIKKDLRTIFGYRSRQIASRLGSAVSALVLALGLSLGGSEARAEDRTDPPVVETVDLQKYAGLWLEVAHSPNFFQRNCVRSTAEYAVLSETQISVHNVCYRESGRTSDISGKATITDPNVPAKLRVRFNFFARGDYWITHLDDDYRWAVVSGPKKKSIFILARSGPLDAVLRDRIVDRLTAEGYRTDNLVYDRY